MILAVFMPEAVLLLDQYLYNPSEVSRKAARDLFRQEHWSIANTMRAVYLDRGEEDYVTALDEIMCGARIEPGWGVIDCSNGNYHLIAENLREKVCSGAK